MSEPTFCYWSIADGPYAEMVQTAVRSARAVGVREDIHVWSDRDVVGATTHDPGIFVKNLYLFKLQFLRHRAAQLCYDFGSSRTRVGNFGSPSPTRVREEPKS